MAKVSLTTALRKEYEDLFNSCLIRPERAQAVSSAIAAIRENRARYQQVEDSLGVPWFVVAVIHNMESSLSFTRHLHNGDPLTGRTTFPGIFVKVDGIPGDKTSEAYWKVTGSYLPGDPRG